MHEKDKNVRKDILPPRTCLVKPFSAPSWRSWCYFFRFFSKRQKKFQAAFWLTFLRDGTDDALILLLCVTQGNRLRRGDSPCSEKVKPHRCSVKGLHWGQPHCHWSYPQFIHFSSPNHSQIHHFIPSPVRRKKRRKGTFRHIVLRGERSCHLGQAPKNVYAQK